ncbi:MAG: TIGR02444 family protein [Kangiellaceae bacterium]|nr:TIGR02444 family protein [Kangiellaceae bacterium]
MNFNKQLVKAQTEYFWQWSCDVYQYTQVRKLCLSLQDSYHLNVNYLLLAIWCQLKSVNLSIEDWRSIETAGENVNQVVETVRRKRKQLKAQPDNSTPNQAYQKALQLELKGEQIIQKAAIQCLFLRAQRNLDVIERLSSQLDAQMCEKLCKEWSSTLENSAKRHNLQTYLENKMQQSKHLQFALKKVNMLAQLVTKQSLVLLLANDKSH